MKRTKKKLLLLMLVASLASTVLYLLLSAIYTVLGSNIVYGSYLTIVDICMWLLNVLSYTAIFSIFIYSTAKNGAKQTLSLILCYCGIILIKNLLAVAINNLILGVGLIAPDVLYPTLVWLLDVALAFAVLFVAYVKAHNTSAAALIVGILLSATTLLPRVIFDIGYGAPSSSSDLFVMIAAYAGDFLTVAIFYFVSKAIFKYLQRGE